MGNFKFQMRRQSSYDRTGVLRKTVRGYYVREVGHVGVTETPVLRESGILEENWPENAPVRLEGGYWILRANRMRARLVEDPNRPNMQYFHDDQDQQEAL